MPTFLITGANRGIGLEFARQLSQRGDTVIAACRRASDELQALGVRVIENVNVTDDASVAALADQLDDGSIDVLVNNAGVLTSETVNDLAFDRIRNQFEINTLGPLRTTAALLPKLSEGAKVAVITSRMGSIADNTSGGYYGYRMSKAAVNAAFRSLAHDLRPRGVAVLILHPGMVATDMTGHAGITPAQSVTGLLARIDTLGRNQSGQFYHANGEPLPW